MQTDHATAIPGTAPGFKLWNLYDPSDRPLLAARLHQIMDQFAAPDADRALAVATLLGEFDRISHTAPPGVSHFAKVDEDVPS